MPAPPPTFPSSTAPPRAAQRLERVPLLDMPAADVVHQAVVGFGDHRHRPGVVAKVLSVMLDHPADRGVMDDADGMGVGETDGAEEIPGVVDPVRAGHFAVAVEVELTGPDGGRRARVPARQHRGDARIDLAVARSGSEGF